MKVRVPASVANVGPGFDILAFAVDLWLEVEAVPASSPAWKWEGEGAGVLAGTDNPLARLPMRGRVRNGIPLGVGLGSSAAARLAAAVLGGDDQRAAFRRAAGEEGHPDNVAAAARGGVVLMAGDEAHPLPVPEVGVALLVANEPAATEAAREVLPATVPLADAVFNASRVAMLVDALHRRDWWRLGAALEDRLHQPHRRHLYPWTADAIAAAHAAGAFGAAVSGAGPTVFAFTRRDHGRAVAEAMAAAAPGRGRPVATRIVESGMSVEP